MEISIILTTLLSIFATSTDLCADVHLDATGQPVTDSLGQSLARFCHWTGPNAPMLTADVCCVIEDDSAACWLPDPNGRCSAGVKRYCEHGEVDSVGGVVCLQPFPDACQAGHCVDAPELPPPTEALVACCTGGVCHLISLTSEEIEGCKGSFVSCGWGQTNSDGTVTCYDP